MGNISNTSSRRRFLKAVGATGVVGLAGCLGKDGVGGDGAIRGGGDAPVELDVWTLFGGGDGKAFESMVESYNEAHDDVTLNRQRIEWSQYYDKLFTALTGGAPPDICVVHTTRMLKFNDAVVDLTPHLSDGASDAYIQSVWDKTAVDGKRSALPLDMHPTGFYYNKDVFEEAGLDPGNTPTNWDEFKATCDAIADAGYSAFIPQPYRGPSHLRPWFQFHRQRGGRLLNDDKTEAAFDTDEGIALTKLWAKMVGEYGWDEPDISANRGTKVFREGNAGIINQGTWYIGALEEVDFEWGMFKPFTAPNKEQGAAWANSHTLAVPKRDDRSKEETQAAVSAIETLTQDAMEWGTVAGHLPASAAVNESDELRETVTWEKTLSTFYEIARDDQMVYLPRHEKLQDVKRPLYKNLQQVWSQQKDPEQAISDAAGSINGIL